MQRHAHAGKAAFATPPGIEKAAAIPIAVMSARRVLRLVISEEIVARRDVPGITEGGKWKRENGKWL
jgi:hypothetical protein